MPRVLDKRRQKARTRAKAKTAAKARQEVWLIQDADGCWWCGDSSWEGQPTVPMFFAVRGMARIAGSTLESAKETGTGMLYRGGFSVRGPLKFVRFVRADDE